VDLTDILKASISDAQREAVMAVLEHGTQRKAAKALGKAQSTISNLIAAAREIAEAGAAPRVESQRVKELERLIELQAARIERMREVDYKIPKGIRLGEGAGSFCRVAIPDTHGSVVDQEALAAFLGDLEVIKPREVILLGDHLECGGFLAQHHTLGYVAQTDYTFEQDAEACNAFLDTIQSLTNANMEFLEGNHERRLETWLLTATAKNRRDGEYLRRLFSVDAVLSLEKRGIRWIRQGVFYDNVSLPATIKKGNCYFTHGSSTARHAASVHVSKFGGNVVYGHTHRADSYFIRNVKDGVIGAWSPGCLCRLQPLWQHTNPTDWSHGYGLQLVNADGSFLHINVPIINGKSYLEPLARAMK
jgi:UDP-2,3-diacylglucosamine pyrophosphatase LpxH